MRYTLLYYGIICKQAILNVLFPISCFGCGQSNILLCQSCVSRIPTLREQLCPYCQHHITPHGETCLACTQKHALDGVFVGYSYDHDSLSKVIRAFKYQSIESLSEPIGTLLIRAITTTDIPLPEYILPVPLHPWRLRYRGFNQSELLGRSLATKLLPGTAIRFDTTSLIRTRFTLPQQKMPNAQARRENIQHAFLVPRSARHILKGKSVWIVDDVSTTTSTLDACAKALKQAGATRVFGIVLARSAPAHSQT